MTMIKQVAGGMERRCHTVMEQRGDASPDIYRRLGMGEWEELARAAIIAMRDISEDLLRAGGTASGDYPWWYEEAFKRSWELVIEAAATDGAT